MNTFGNDAREVPPQSQRAVAGRQKRQPTVGEMVQIIRDLLPEKWKLRPLVQNPAIRREAITAIFEEALDIWMIGDRVCYRHRPFKI